MDYLISNVSLDSFYQDIILPLSFFGIGSVKDILSMKMWEIREALICLKDDDTQKLFRATRGIMTDKK